MDFKQSLESVRVEHNIKYSFKEKQIEALDEVCHQRSVFCLLPTGYGKTDIMVLPPLILDKVC